MNPILSEEVRVVLDIGGEICFRNMKEKIYDVTFCEYTLSFEYPRRWKKSRSPDRNASNSDAITMGGDSKHQSAICVGSCRLIPAHFTGSARME